MSVVDISFHFFDSFLIGISDLDHNICIMAYCNNYSWFSDIVIRGFLATKWYLIYIFANSISDAIIFFINANKNSSKQCTS